jgi:predicted DNA-binding antitoxin AbrB/MazE fold protein
MDAALPGLGDETMDAIQAIYENGVFRPVAPVTLPEQTRVTVTPVVEAPAAQSESDEIYEILDRRYNSGHADTAACHNEHQP